MINTTEEKDRIDKTEKKYISVRSYTRPSNHFVQHSKILYLLLIVRQALTLQVLRKRRCLLHSIQKSFQLEGMATD